MQLSASRLRKIKRLYSCYSLTEIEHRRNGQVFEFQSLALQLADRASLSDDDYANKSDAFRRLQAAISRTDRYLDLDLFSHEVVDITNTT